MRYKGQITPAIIDRDYPHQVEIFVPGDGLGVRLNVMHEFCHSFDYKTRGIATKQWTATGRDGIRWCFRNGEEAATFQERFGGKRLTIDDRLRASKYFAPRMKRPRGT